MKKLKNETLQNFIEQLIEELKMKNGEIEFDGFESLKLNIPFIISTLYQDFNNNTCVYKKFIEDLNFYSDYNIDIIETDNDYNGIIDVYITLIKTVYEKKYTQHHDLLYSDYDYKISFNFEDRHWGYCECTPDMPDYREDKQCCGNGCDANFCEFNLYQIMKVAHGSWEGDEHDYWDFEDDFYKTDEELLLKKQKEDKKHEIELCKKCIEEYTKKLTELLGGEK